MTRAKFSGDCRMTAYNAPQAATHKSASMANAATNRLLSDLAFALRTIVPTNFIDPSEVKRL